MDFELLQSRLVSRLRSRVRNGELSERRIARLTGISQPHIHNVLKGARCLSSEVADLLLLHMNISLTDLLDPSETRHTVGSEIKFRAVPAFDGRLGPAYDYPAALSGEQYLAPSALVSEVDEPVFARLATDPSMQPLIEPNRLVLLDRGEPKRTCPESGTLYAVVRAGKGAVRHVRRGMGCLYLLTNRDMDRPQQWERVSLENVSPLSVIRGRVVWITDPAAAAPAPPG